MKKQVIRLTEEDLNKIIMSAVNEAIEEKINLEKAKKFGKGAAIGALGAGALAYGGYVDAQDQEAAKKADMTQSEIEANLNDTTDTPVSDGRTYHHNW